MFKFLKTKWVNLNNPLLFMRFMVITVLSRIKKSRIFSIGMLIFSFFLLILHGIFIVLLSENFSTAAKFSFIPIYLIYTFVGWIFQVFSLDYTEFCAIIEETSWSLKKCTFKTRNEIFLTGFIEEAKYFIGFIIFCIAIFFIAFYGKIENIDILNYYIKHHNYSHWSHIYQAIVVTYAFLNIPILTGIPCIFYYTLWIQQFQAVLLADYVGKNLKNASGTEIETKLKIVIQRHVELLNFRKLHNKYLSIRLCSLILGLYGGIAVICFFSNIAIRNQVIFSLLCILVSLVHVEMICSAAQGFEDASELIRITTLNLPWYKWDLKEQKSILLLVQNTSQIEHFKFFNSAINKEFLIAYLYKIYSFATVLISTLK